MKIKLVFPEFTIYFTYEGPIGLAYLKAVAQRSGHEVGVIDNNVLNLPHTELIERLRGADLIGISMATSTYGTVKGLCKLIRRKLKIPVVLGGPHPTIDPKDCLGFADYVIIGEGEATFSELLAAIENGATHKALSGIIGLGFRRGKRRVINPPRPLNTDLDSLPFPDWRGFPIERYGSALRVSGRGLPVVTSRGCPYNCVYCFKGLFGRNFRARSPKNVVDEIEHLKEEYGLREFQIADDAFATDRKRAVEICKELVRRGVNVPFSLPNGIRANSLNDELVRWMKKAGLQYLGLGIESGNQGILDRAGKQQTLGDVERAVKLLKKHKVTTVGFFMFGLPGETEETMADTVRFAKKLDLTYYSISMTTPYPGTVLYDKIKKGGGTMLTKTPEELFSLGSGCKYIMPGMAEPEVIEKAYRKARMQLLLRPKTIIRTLLTNPKRLISGAKVAYKWLLKT